MNFDKPVLFYSYKSLIKYKYVIIIRRTKMSNMNVTII